MSSKKRKQYLYNKNAPLTSYARKKIKKCLKRELQSREGTNQKDNTLNQNVTYENFLTSSDESIVDNEPLDMPQLFIGASASDDSSSGDEEIATIPTNFTPKSIRELININDFSKLTGINVQRRPAELLLMILKFAISNSLSMTGISNLLKLINIVCGKEILPETRYKIDQLWNNDNIKLHAICPGCTMYIGTFKDFHYLTNCTHCGTPVDMSNRSSLCYFATFDPTNALRDCIESNESYYDYIVNEREHEKNHIKDIYDGVLYRKFVQRLNNSDRHAYATVMFNTDGAPVFESSTYSIWPIYSIVNEIPIKSRMNSAITVGLWFGQSKPVMNVFLDVFVNMINDLSTMGVPCVIKNEERRIKIFALVACVDTVARAPMNGTSQFNAKYGCDWCLHEGKWMYGSMRYPFKIPLPKLRDHNSTIKHAEKAVKKQIRVFGVKTASPLLNLNMFDIIEGFTPDYMHCYVEGVGKQFTTYILRRLRKKDIIRINQLLESIRAPHLLGRLTRSLKHRKYWKAREHENWILYYSIPLLTAVFDDEKIIKHWSLLVNALHILLQTDITYDKLNQANNYLHEFVSKCKELYSVRALTYNVHQLLHIGTSIHNWGPLFAHSTYPFESANGKLLKAIHCAKGVVLQISRYDNIQRTIQLLSSSIYQNCNQNVIQYCENMKAPLTKKTLKISNINYLGKGETADDCIIEKYNISKNAKFYHKIILNGCLFMTSRKKNKRSCNYFVQLDSGEYVKIKYFVVSVETNQELTICDLINTNPNKYSSAIREILTFSNEICVDTMKISKTCVCIEVGQKMYISATPNQLFY